MRQALNLKNIRNMELREALEYEHETLTHNLMMEDPTIGKAGAIIKAMTFILRKEREHCCCNHSVTRGK